MVCYYANTKLDTILDHSDTRHQEIEDYDNQARFEGGDPKNFPIGAFVIRNDRFSKERGSIMDNLDVKLYMKVSSEDNKNGQN